MNDDFERRLRADVMDQHQKLEQQLGARFDGLEQQLKQVSTFFKPPSTTISSHLMKEIHPRTTVITE